MLECVPVYPALLYTSVYVLISYWKCVSIVRVMWGWVGVGGGECVLVVGSMCGVCVDVQLASMCGCWGGGG